MKKEEYIVMWEFTDMGNITTKGKVHGRLDCEKNEIIRLTPIEAERHLKAGRIIALKDVAHLGKATWRKKPFKKKLSDAAYKKLSKRNPNA